MMRMLLGNGGDEALRTNESNTAQDITARGAHENCVELLIRQ